MMPAPTLPSHLIAVLDADPPDPVRAPRLVQLHLEGLLGSRGAASGEFDDVCATIATIRSRLPKERPEDAAALRVEHALRRAELQLAAHGVSGHDTDESLERYRTFMDENAGRLFDSLFAWLESRVEDDLYVAQLLHFNSFRFAEVQATLDEDLEMVERVLHAIKDYDLDDRQTRDAQYARLLGTCGQAYGFLASLESDGGEASALFDRAAELLRRDVGCLGRGTPLWIQGASFLSALEWRRGDLNAAIRWLSESLLRPAPLGRSQLGKLAGADGLIPASHPQFVWLWLNQLRACALGLHIGALSLDHDILAAAWKLCRGWDRVTYPKSLAVKWLLVLDALSECSADENHAWAVDALSGARSAPVLELMRAVELSLLARLTQSGRSGGDLAVAACRVLDKLAGAGRYQHFIGGSRWACSLSGGTLSALSPWEIATALPYYYA